MLIHSCSFGLVRSQLLTLSKPRRTRHCLPCLRRNRSMVLFCSGALLQGHWFPKAGSLCWHADSFKSCLTEQPRAINHLTSMWNDAVSQAEERKRTSRTFALYISDSPTMKLLSCPWQRIFPYNKNLLRTEDLFFSLRQGNGHSFAATCIVTH